MNAKEKSGPVVQHSIVDRQSITGQQSIEYGDEFKDSPSVFFGLPCRIDRRESFPRDINLRILLYFPL